MSLACHLSAFWFLLPQMQSKLLPNGLLLFSFYQKRLRTLKNPEARESRAEPAAFVSERLLNTTVSKTRGVCCQVGFGKSWAIYTIVHKIKRQTLWFCQTMYIIVSYSPTDKLFLSSSDKFLRLSLSSWSQINITTKHGIQSLKWHSFTSVS